MIEIKSVNKKSLAKITALAYGLVGFITAMVVAILTMVNIMMKRDFQGSAVLVTLYNVGAGLLLGVLTALLTALIGLIMGYLGGGIYNWFARKVGGIKVELEDVVKESEKGLTEKAEEKKEEIKN